MAQATCGALQERFYFGDTVLPLFESGIPLVKEYLVRLPDADNITIAYPDEGAWKRFHAQLGEYPEVTRLSPGDPKAYTLGQSQYALEILLLHGRSLLRD